MTLGEVQHFGPTVDVVAKVIDESRLDLDESAPEGFAVHLAAEANRGVEEKKAEGYMPIGIVSSRIARDPGPSDGWTYILVVKIAVES